MRNFLLIILFIPLISFSQEKKNAVDQSMNQSLENACTCGQVLIKKIEKRKVKGKKVFFNPREEAHNCAQSALDEYWVMIYEQSGGFNNDQTDSKRHNQLIDEYNRRVYNECAALEKLHNMKK